MQALTDRREFTVDPELPTVELLKLDASQLRHTDVVIRPNGNRVVLQAKVTNGWWATLEADTDLADPFLFTTLVDGPFTVERPVYVVEYRAEHLGVTELVRVEFEQELDAVHCMGSVILYDNLSPVARGANIDPTRFAI